jgi:hypothetical protein
VLVDLRNIYDPVAMRQSGFAYHGVGRGGADHKAEPDAVPALA